MIGWIGHLPGLKYFDFVSIFIFLMLAGRWLQQAAVERNRRRLLQLSTVAETVETLDATGRPTKIRIEDIKPDFDVFALSKLLWTMISGKPRMQLWYWNDARFDLSVQFPDDAHVARVNRIFEQTLVQFSRDCLPTATDLLTQIDEAIGAIETSTQLPSTARPMRCRFCGIGTYQRFSGIQSDGFADPADRRHTWWCNKCGHLESFLWKGDQPPQAWHGH